MPEVLSMTQLLDQLKGRGFTANFGVVGDALQVLDTGKVFRPDEIVVRAS